MKTKKLIGIVTIIDRNLGNRLQNYALQEYLLAKGFNVKTIPMNTQNFVKKEIKYFIKKFLSYIVAKYKSVSWDSFDRRIIWEKYSIKDYPKLLTEKYDYFIAGSDQIWNPLFDFNSDREFLTFARPEQRVAYAASIGISELPKDCEEHYAESFKGFSALSVREDDAAKIIDNLINRTAQVVIDPTMLLTRDKWKEISESSQIHIKYKYVVKYFLGNRNSNYDQYIEKKAKEADAKVLDITEYNKENGSIIGPAEFVYLIANSVGVFTDSFHGSIFSILFEKPFLVFDRPSDKQTGDMSSRIDTLLNKFDLKAQRVSNDEKFSDVQPVVAYNKINKILEKERKIAENYLKHALLS